MSHAEQPFRVDGKLKANIIVAISFVILCPVALWFFYFRYDHIPGSPVKQEAEQLIANFCRAYNKPDFHSKEVFADTLQYMDIPGVTTVDVDHEVAVARQTEMYPRITLLNGTLRDTTIGETTKADVWLQEVVYMKSRMQYRSREMHYEFAFNTQGKIISIDTSGVRNEKFGSQMPK